MAGSTGRPPGPGRPDPGSPSNLPAPQPAAPTPQPAPAQPATPAPPPAQGSGKQQNAPAPPKPPKLEVTPTKLEFTAMKGAKDKSQTLQIRNSGEGTINWRVRTLDPWIQISVDNGAGNADLTITVQLSNLTIGQHTGNLVITANGAVNRIEIPVTAEIEPTPAVLPILEVTPAELKLSAHVGDTAFVSGDLQVSNTGRGTLNWKAGITAPFLGITPASGTGNGTIKVRCNPTGLPEGEHHAEIVVSEENGPQKSVPVLFTVTARHHHGGEEHEEHHGAHHHGNHGESRIDKWGKRIALVALGAILTYAVPRIFTDQPVHKLEPPPVAAHSRTLPSNDLSAQTVTTVSEEKLPDGTTKVHWPVNQVWVKATRVHKDQTVSADPQGMAWCNPKTQPATGPGGEGKLSPIANTLPVPSAPACALVVKLGKDGAGTSLVAPFGHPLTATEDADVYVMMNDWIPGTKINGKAVLGVMNNKGDLPLIISEGTK